MHLRSIVIKRKKGPMYKRATWGRFADDQLQVTGRDDICADSGVSPDQFSPYLDRKFFKVPRVIEQN